MYDDLTEFQRWAAGNLVDNRNRGIFAEWLVSQALDAIGETDVRKEWDAVDVRFGGLAIEVKASGLSQTWNQSASSTPRFDVAPQKTAWNADTDDWVAYDPPQRTADVYVFCLLAYKGDKRMLNPLDLSQWEFYVVKTSEIDRIFGERSSISINRIKELSQAYSVDRLSDAVEAEYSA